MTAHVPPAQYSASASQDGAHDIAAGIFKGLPDEQRTAALAALGEHRPDLRLNIDPDDLARHDRLWPRDARYFGRMCRLLKAYRVGAHWGQAPEES